MEWLDRMVLVMNIVSDAPAEGMGVTEIARETGFSKGTLHRMLRDMAARSLVVQSPLTKRYRLGPLTMTWGSKYVQGQDPSGLLSGYCDLLAERTGFYTFLCRLDGGNVYCTHTCQPDTSRRTYFVHVGQRMPLHCTAAAKAILAFLPADRVLTLLAGDVNTPYTDKTTTTAAEILQELAAVREQKVAFCREELELGVSAIAVPVFSGEREAIFSITIIGGAQYVSENEVMLIKALTVVGREAGEHMKTARLLTSARV